MDSNLTNSHFICDTGFNYILFDTFHIKNQYYEKNAPVLLDKTKGYLWVRNNVFDNSNLKIKVKDMPYALFINNTHINTKFYDFVY